MNPAVMKRGSDPLIHAEKLAQVRKLVLQWGWNATSYQLLNPGMRYWFSREGDAVVGFVSCGATRVVAGAPICAEARLPAIIGEFEGDADRQKQRVCYFCAEARLEGVLRKVPDHAEVLLGAQPVFQPAEWVSGLESRASLRAQLHRAGHKGVSIQEWPESRAQGHPELRRCLEEWLATRRLPTLHFLVEPDTFTHWFDRRIFVALRNSGVVGFLVICPVPQRHGWLIEQIVRGNGAPNGTAELLIDAAMRTVAAEHSAYVTLGLSPLSRRATRTLDTNPFWLRLTLGWVRAQGRSFYNFEGLDAFKAKFGPAAWEPVFAICNRRRFGPSMLYAIAAAFTEGRPLRTIAQALSGAFLRKSAGLWRRPRSAGSSKT